MQGAKTVDCEVGDGKLYVTRLRPMRGWRYTAVLGRIVGPALARFAALRTVTQDNLAAHADILAAAVDLFFENVTPDVLEDMTRELLAPCEYIRPDETGQLEKFSLGNAQHFDRAFMGRLSDLLRCFRAAFEVNFADFIADVLKQLNDLFARPDASPETQEGPSSTSSTSAPSPSTSETPGPSGDSG